MRQSCGVDEPALKAPFLYQTQTRALLIFILIRIPTTSRWISDSRSDSVRRRREAHAHPLRHFTLMRLPFPNQACTSILKVQTNYQIRR